MEEYTLFVEMDKRTFGFSFQSTSTTRSCISPIIKDNQFSACAVVVCKHMKSMAWQETGQNLEKSHSKALASVSSHGKGTFWFRALRVVYMLVNAQCTPHQFLQFLRGPCRAMIKNGYETYRLHTRA